MLRLLLLNYEYPPLGGGAGKATQAIAQQLAAMGHNVDVVTSNIEFSYNETVDNGVKVHAVPSLRKGIHDCGFRGAITYLFFAYFKILRLFSFKNYDVVHYFFGLPTALIALLPGKHRQVPYIVSLRGSDVPHYDQYNKRLELFHRFFLPLTKFIWNHAKAITAVSTSLRQTALQINTNKPIEVISNGIDTDMFTPLSNTKRTNNEFRLVTVSRLIKRKGIQNVLQALAEIQDDSIKLAIIGEGNYETELRNICNNLGLNSSVSFMGFRKRDALPEYFSQSDVFILPSLAEAFGNVIAEAMACGLPIISSNEGGIPDLVNDENGILINSGSIEEIKAAILKMKTDEQMRRRMRKSNIGKIRENFKWEMVALAYYKIYLKSISDYQRKIDEPFIENKKAM
jgi:glycosyltransferase involved in cell wall biosynthesis